jgi:hypothetical protein
MTYEEFRALFLRSLRESGLPHMGFQEETLDLRMLARTFKVFVEPVGGHRTEPFHATAAIWWTWSAFQTSRGIFREEDALGELLGRREEDLDTEPPRLRIDIKLAATTMHGQALPMPWKQKWASWAQETLGRLERIEPLLPDEHVEELEDGQLAILAWQGSPTGKVECSPDGGLRLQRVDLEAFQIINLPRRWDVPDRKPDERPDRHLDAMFARVKASLHAWTEALDHLKA